MKKILGVATVLALAGVFVETQAQVTLLPAFNAPDRAFAEREFGGAVSFVTGGTGFEGLFGIGLDKIDVSFRGGIVDPDFGDAQIRFGAAGKAQVLEADEDIPVDASAVVGVGVVLSDGSNGIVIPGGLSVGRRFEIEDGLSILVYGQPTIFLTAGDPGTDLSFAFGFGGDLRIQDNIDIRVSVGAGDIEGVTLGVVLVR